MIVKSNKSTLIIIVSLAVVATCSLWLYRTQIGAPKFNQNLHRAVGRTMADQTAKLLGETGRIVVIAIELAGAPELKEQLDEFQRALHNFRGLSISKTYNLETEKKPKYGVGSGLSGRRYVRIVNKNPEADAFVSFVGAPTMSDEEVTELKRVPKFLAEARSADKLKKLFDQKVLQLAIVSRFEFPTPVRGKPGTLQEWFDQRFQVVTAADAKRLPSGKDE